MINKENNYNIIRFVCACFVIYGHMFIFYGYPATSLFANEISALGFKMLMVLSGLMITQSCLRDKNFFRYALKRIFRIFPALIVCVTFTTLVLGPLVSTLSVREYLSHPGTWEYLFSNIFLRPAYLLPGVFENNPYAGGVNGSLWALPV